MTARPKKHKPPTTALPMVQPGFLIEPDDKKLWARYMSITVQEESKNVSFEEIRLQDYASNLPPRVTKLRNGHTLINWNPEMEKAQHLALPTIGT